MEEEVEEEVVITIISITITKMETMVLEIITTIEGDGIITIIIKMARLGLEELLTMIITIINNSNLPLGTKNSDLLITKWINKEIIIAIIITTTIIITKEDGEIIMIIERYEILKMEERINVI